MAWITLKLTSFSCMMAVSRYFISSPRVWRPLRLTTHFGWLIDFRDSVIFMRVSFWWNARINLLSSSFVGTHSSLESPLLWKIMFWITSYNYYFVISKSMISFNLLSLFVFSSLVYSARYSLYLFKSSDITRFSYFTTLFGSSFYVKFISINLFKSMFAFVS